MTKEGMEMLADLKLHQQELEEETKRLRHQQERLEEELRLLEDAVKQKMDKKKKRLNRILHATLHEQRLNDIPQWVKNLSEEEKKQRLEKWRRNQKK